MQAGWYPDPVGDHEFRYHNGLDWTGDVADDGVRHVTTVPARSGSRFPRRNDPRSATVAMVFGITAMLLGIVPFVCVIAAVFGVVAIVVGARRMRFESARGAATAGIVTGSIGVVLSIGGLWLTTVVLGAVADFENPGPYEIELVSCEQSAAGTRATGWITNLDDRDRSYTISVALNDTVGADALLEDVPAGERREFRAEENLRLDDVDCSIGDVTGPRPFGIEQ